MVQIKIITDKLVCNYIKFSVVNYNDNYSIILISLFQGL